MDHFLIFRNNLFYKIFLYLIIVSVSFFVSGNYAFSQSSDPNPKIGLALSGGSAHGIAHLGVLKVMEEAGLYPDYITGVSIGSIIGSYYSIGYSPDSIARIFKAADWNLILSDKIPENKVIFQEKKHFYNSILALPVTSEKIVLPSGMISGQQIDNMLSYYAWPAATINDFSMLPVPFLCIGTDIMTGTKVVLKSGYLPEAIRASIAIPSVFTPEKIDNRLLVDGGVVRNFAVSELKEMGAGIVIGSYVGFLPKDSTDIESIEAILKHVGFLSSLRDYEDEKKLTDVLIVPKVKDYPSMTFTNVDSLYAAGYRAALPYKEYFRELASQRDTCYNRHNTNILSENKYYIFDDIQVRGNKINTDEQIKGILDIQPGDTVTRDILNDAIELLYGKAWFEKVNYRIGIKNDSVLLTINCTEKPRAMLYGSVHYDNELGAGLLLSMSVKNLLTRRSVINLDTYVAQYYKVNASISQFIDKHQKFYLEGVFFSESVNLPLIMYKGVLGSMDNSRYMFGFALNKRLGLNNMASLSSSFEGSHLYPDYISMNHIRRLTHYYANLSFTYQTNTLDKKHFPDKGIEYSFTASASKLVAGVIKTDTLKGFYNLDNPGDFDFNRFYYSRIHAKCYFSPSRRFTIALGGDILYTSDADSISSNNNFHFLGGYDETMRKSIPMVGFNANEVSVKNLAGIGIDADMEILKDIHLTMRVNAFAIQEPDRISDLSFLFGYSIGIGYNSIIGPIRAGMMHGFYERGIFYSPVKGYISIGYNF